MRWFILLVLPAIALSQCISQDDSALSNDTASDEALILGQQKFSIDMLKIVNGLKNGPNIFFSPHSIYQSLLLAYIAAANETEQVIQKALNLPETQTKIETMQSYIKGKYSQQMREINGSSDYSYNVANRIFMANNIASRECMEKLLTDELEKIDFPKNPEAALLHMNSWVSNITKGQIQDLIPSEAVDSSTKMVLANAAYFKGLWKSKFLKENTKKNGLFYVSTSEIRVVDFMHQKGTFNHMLSERLKAHVLEMPYKGGDISMIVILPRYEDNAIDKLIKSLNEESLQEILGYDSLYPRPIDVYLPKFTVEETMDLRPTFDHLGLSDMFNVTSDFTSLTENDEGIHFDDAVHKAKIEVDEEGTTAAAATAIFSFRSSRPLEPTTFDANHPFVYMIYDKVSQNILFLGAYKLPSKKHYPSKRRSGSN